MKKINWWKVARLVISAVRTAISESESAKDPASDGGSKVTAEEALEISSAVLASLVEPLADLLGE
ncbi:MAG: hypothetical protein ACR2NI_11060 [Pirellulales bacterium]